MKRNKNLILIVIINLTFYNAQNTVAGEQNSIENANSKALNYEQDFNVDLYTGTVNIGLPLQKLQEDSFSMDLSLNYDATGVLINNVSGIVGQNWNLNAGGTITRKIKGTTFDELNYDGGLFQPGVAGALSNQTGFFEAKILLNRNDWNSVAHLRKVLARAASTSIFGNAQPPYDPSSIIDFGDGLPNFSKTWKVDTEPDIFYFNFFGKSGFFFMGEDGNWKVSSKDNLKVIYNSDLDLINPLQDINHSQFQGPLTDYKRKSIGRLTLLDDKGFQYVFGDNDMKSMEITLGSYYDSKLLWPYISKWNLKKVIDPNGKTLFNFIYITGQYFLTNLFAEGRLETSSNENNTNFPSFSQNPGTYSSFYHWYRESGDFYKPSYLKQILLSNGSSVDFSYIEKPEIQFTASGNLLFDPYASSLPNIFYPVFNRHWTNETLPYLYTDEIPHNIYTGKKSIRYVLDEIKVKFNNNLINKFNFQYANNLHDRVFLYQVIKNNDEKHTFFYNDPNSIPGYFSEKKDMWGYYNGYSTSISVSQNYTFWENFEADKYSSRSTVTSKLLSGSLSQIIWPTGGITNFVFEPHTFRKRISNQYSTFNGAVLLETFPNGGGGLRIKKIVTGEKEREFFYNNTFEEIDYNISSGILMYEPLFFTRHKVYELNAPNGGGLTIEPIPIESGGTSSANGINPKSDFFNSNVAYSTVLEKNNDGFIKYTFTDFNDYPDYYVTNGLRPLNKLSKKIDFSFERGKIKSTTYFNASQNKILEKNYIYKNLFELKGKAIDYNYFTSNWSNHPGDDAFPPFGFYPIPQPSCYACNSRVDPYFIYYTDKVLDSEITTEYFQGGRKIESLKRYYYQSPVDPSYSLIDKIEEYPNKNDLSKFKSIKFQYAVDMGTSDAPFTDMIAKNMIGIPLAITRYNEQQQPITKAETIFAKNSSTNNLLLPVSTRTIKTGMSDYGSDASVDTKITYDLYDSQGHVLQYTDQSGIPTTIILGYNKSQPIAKIVGATYNYVNASTNIGHLQDASDADIDTASENTLISLLDDLRKNAAFKDYQITTYTYDPLIGITSLTSPDGLREYYKYNLQNHKLEKVIDADGKTVEEYKYHYKN